jgi:hypothetical protein
LPAFEFGVGDELGLGEFFALMSTLADAVAEFDACFEVAVAVSVKCVAGRSGAASSAWTSTCCPELSPPTVQSAWPDGTQTENVGLALLGFADRVILAVPPVPLVSQTQMAYDTVVCGSTALTLLSVCTVMHKVAGGVVGVVVGVGVAVVVGVAVAIGDLSGPPGVSGLELARLAGPGCGSPPGFGEAELPGLGCGSGGGLALRLGWVLGSGGVLGLLVCVWLAVTDACPAGALASVCGPECLLTGTRRTASASSTGMAAGWRARACGSTSALVVAVAVGLAVADEHGFVLAGRDPCTPVRSMLTAP